MMSTNRNQGKRLTWCAALALTPLLIGLPSQTSSVALGGTKKPANKMTGEKKSAATPAIDQAAMAARLAMRGEKARSPILMLAAAELLSGLREGKAQSVTTATKSADAKNAPQKGSEKKTGELSIANLVDKALEFARGDKEMTAFVEKRAEKLSSRGLVNGAGKATIRLGGRTFKIISRGYIRPGYRLTINNVRFAGRRPARIVVAGDGDGDLDLWVYDGNNGALIRRDTDRSSTCAVSWTPRYTGPFKVVIRNVGRVTEKYYVLANW